MKLFRFPLAALLMSAVLLVPGRVLAQDDGDDIEFDDDGGDGKGGDDIEFDEGGDTDTGGDTGGLPDDLDIDVDDDDGEGGAKAPLVLDGSGKLSWKDIVVVVRKPFLKIRRIELLPQWGVTMNDNLVRHLQFSGTLNYYLSDVLAVGVEAAYYVKDLREPFDLVARQARRLPTVNQYNFGGALNFSYVPIYGKFAVLDSHIVHWESYFTAGVGFTQSETIPRDPAMQPFKNFLITPNVGASMRFFLSKWMTINVGIRDYVFVDKFEAPGRMEFSADAAKDNATSSLINNVVFQVGLSFWVPPTFKYTTFR